jgi:hypothetical protein
MNDVDLGFLNLRFVDNESMASWQFDRVGELHITREQLRHKAVSPLAVSPRHDDRAGQASVRPLILKRWRDDEQSRLAHLVYTNEWRCAQRPLYGLDLRYCVCLPSHLALLPAGPVPLVHSYEMRARAVRDLVTRFTCIITPARAPPPLLHCSHPHPSDAEALARTTYQLTQVRSSPPPSLGARF